MLPCSLTLIVVLPQTSLYSYRGLHQIPCRSFISTTTSYSLINTVFSSCHVMHHHIGANEDEERGFAFSVQSSYKLNVPTYLIIHAANLKLQETIGQGRSNCKNSSGMKVCLSYHGCIQVNLELFTRGKS